MVKFGEYALEGFLKGAQDKKEQDQFNREMAANERKQSLLTLIENNKLRQQQLEYESKFIDVKPGDRFNEIGAPVGKQPISLLDNFISLAAANARKKDPMLRYGKPEGSNVAGEIYGHMEDGKEVITGFEPASSGSSDKSATEYQRYRMEQDEIKKEETRLANISTNQLKLEALLGAQKGEPTELTDKSGMKRTGYMVGGNFVDKSLVKPQTKNLVDALIKDYGLTETKNDVMAQVKQIIRKNGVTLKKGDRTVKLHDMNRLSPDVQRMILTKAINGSDMPEDEKRVLSSYFEHVHRFPEQPTTKRKVTK